MKGNGYGNLSLSQRLSYDDSQISTSLKVSRGEKKQYQSMFLLANLNLIELCKFAASENLKKIEFALLNLPMRSNYRFSLQKLKISR